LLSLVSCCIALEAFVSVLKKSHWLLQKREQNLKTKQRFRLGDLRGYNLKTVTHLPFQGSLFGNSGITTPPPKPAYSSMNGAVR
jgi:hypothetical protein